jgi:CubicO group peptidase (beta-lactamase class C family)
MTTHRRRQGVLLGTAVAVVVFAGAWIVASRSDTRTPTPSLATVPSPVTVPSLVTVPSPSADANRALALDDFESGTLDDWRTADSGAGGWLVVRARSERGSDGPTVADELPDPPQGSFAAVTAADGPGTHILYRDVRLDGRFDLTLTVFYAGGAPFSSPATLAHDAIAANQQFRIDIVDPAAPIDSLADGDVLATVFRTTESEPTNSLPTDVSVDLSAWSGRTVRFRLAEVDSQGPLSVGVDDIHFKAHGTGSTDRVDLPPTPEAVSAVDVVLHRLPEAEALAALRDRAAALAAADEFSGAVLVARDGKVLFQDAWGLADRAAGTSATTETRFRMGSMNKMITAVATLQLVEAGKLALDEPIGTYLTDYPNQEVATKVTIRHLLSHTGGTGDIFGRTFDAKRLKLRDHTDYVDLYGSRGLRFEPGSQFEYSNYGFVLLGAIIEAVSGDSYYDYVNDHIYEPAGMLATGSLPESTKVPDRAIGYIKRLGGWVPNTDTLPWRGTSAGGGYSTVGDLYRFARALEDETLISAASFAQATQAQSEESYGFGFGISGEGSTTSYGHSGGAPGMNGELHVYPQLGYIVVGLSNLDPPAVSPVLDYFTERMPLD